MLEFLEALLILWPVHALIALVFAVPTYLITRKRMIWHGTDCFAFVIPWLLWFAIFAFGPRAASLTSAIAENILLGCAVGVSSIVFVLLERRLTPTSVRRWLLSIICGFAVVMWAAFPFLGE